MGFRGLGFRGLGGRGLGFRDLGSRVVGFRVNSSLSFAGHTWREVQGSWRCKYS